ncbi:MAG: helix-turn-helix transcriptional regulator [Bacteroides sp.]|nr:helix-turn-helix transcriptional regulator [Bacteroides sp.]
MENEKYKNLRTGIKFSGRTYFCALELALELIGGKWKPMILYHLKNGPMRSADLQKKLRSVSNKMFIQSIRALEHDGLVKREVFPVAPPKVEYSLTQLGDSVIPLIMQMGYWGESISE